MAESKKNRILRFTLIIVLLSVRENVSAFVVMGGRNGGCLRSGPGCGKYGGFFVRSQVIGVGGCFVQASIQWFPMCSISITAVTLEFLLSASATSEHLRHAREVTGFRGKRIAKSAVNPCSSVLPRIDILIIPRIAILAIVAVVIAVAQADGWGIFGAIFILLLCK